MAFIITGTAPNTTVTSFAEFQDVVDRDKRLFDTNEGLTDDIVEAHLTRATERILTKIRASKWWKQYFTQRGVASANDADVPVVDANKIIDRTADFTDLCVFSALAEYILPLVADFGSEDNAERQKMEYYTARSLALFDELIVAGDWYDFDGGGVVTASEKQVGYNQLKRVR